MNVENSKQLSQSIYDDDIANTEKLTGSKWAIIEKPLDEREKKISEMIMNYGEKSANVSDELNLLSSKIIIIGEIYYSQIRSELINSNLLDLSDKKQENNKSKEELKEELKKNKMIEKELKKTTNKVKLESISDKLFDKIEVLKNILSTNMNTDSYESNISKCKNYLEFRIIILMKMLENEIKNKTKTKSNNINSETDEIILGSKKILFSLKKNKISNNYRKICVIEHVEFNICDLLIDDLENKIDELLKIKNINLYDIANRNPRLIYETLYDETLPNQRLKMHDSQKQALDIIKNNVDNGFLLLYKTLPGLGKTTMIIGVCSFIRKMNLMNVKNNKNKITVIFCCSDILESVKMQVLRIAFNFSIKFGVAVSNKNKTEYKIINSWNCPNDDSRELIAADYVSTSLILKENNSNYLLFFDEPTFLTDNESNKLSLKYLSDILYHLPKYTILSSATLPNKDELTSITDDFEEKYPASNVEEIISNKTLTGCFIKDFNSKIIVPHMYCKNIDELKNLVNKIKKYPSIGKFYTLPFLLNFNEFCKEYGINLEFETIENFEQDNILENILLLFNKFINFIYKMKKTFEDNKDSDDDSDISGLPDPEHEKIYNKFIHIQINEVNENNFDETIIDKDYDNVVMNKLLSSHAYKYIGCCLIADDDPMDFAKNKLFDVVNRIKKKIGMDSMTRYYQNYKDEKNLFEASVDNIEKKCKSDDKVDERISKLKKPEFVFNRSLEINTAKHISNFAKYVKKYDANLLKKEIRYEDIDLTEYKVDDNIKFLLFMGVGLYSKNLDGDYTTKVLELLAEERLAYIITDESFTYGANYPITNIIITDEFANNHSINTLFQLIGRTSRIGQSWSGKVHLDKCTVDRLIKYFMGLTNNNDERDNIVNYYAKNKREILRAIEDKKNKNKKAKSKPVKLIIDKSNVISIDNSKKYDISIADDVVGNEIISNDTRSSNGNFLKKLREELQVNNVQENNSDSDDDYRRNDRFNRYERSDRYNNGSEKYDRSDDKKRYEETNDLWKNIKSSKNISANKSTDANTDINIENDITSGIECNNKKKSTSSPSNKWGNIKNDEFDFIKDIKIDDKKNTDDNENIVDIVNIDNVADIKVAKDTININTSDTSNTNNIINNIDNVDNVDNTIDKNRKDSKYARNKSNRPKNSKNKKTDSSNPFL
jgi:hypothetical protein